MELIYSEERAWRAASVRPRAVTPAMQRLASSFSSGLERHERACWEGAVAPHALPLDAGVSEFSTFTKKEMVDHLNRIGVNASMKMMRSTLQRLCENRTVRVSLR